MRHQKVYVNHVHSSFLLSQLAHMWRKQELCDAIITTENNIVSQVHRVVLLACCPALQTSKVCESIGTMLEVHFVNPDITTEAVNVILQYLYEGSMLLTEDNVKCVIKVASLLQVNSAYRCCLEFLESLGKSINFSNKPEKDKHKWNDNCHVRSIDIKECSLIGSEHHQPSNSVVKRSATDISKTMTNIVQSQGGNQAYVTQPDKELILKSCAIDTKGKDVCVVQIGEKEKAKTKLSNPVNLSGATSQNKPSHLQIHLNVPIPVSNNTHTTTQNLVKSFPLVPIRFQSSLQTGILNIAPLSSSPVVLSPQQGMIQNTGAFPQVIAPIAAGQSQGISVLNGPQPNGIQQSTQHPSVGSISQTEVPLHSESSLIQKEQHRTVQPSLDELGIIIKKESESLQEDTDSNHDKTNETYDLSKVKIEKDLDVSTGGLTLQVDNEQGYGQQLGYHDDDVDMDYEDSDDDMSQDEDDMADSTAQSFDQTEDDGNMNIEPISDASTSTQFPKKIKPIRPRFKTATEEEIRALEDIPQANSTKNATKWGVKCIQEWSREQFGKDIDFSTISAEDLGSLLCKFYAEAAPKPNRRDEDDETDNGRIYNKNTMKSIRASINRHLRDIDRNIDIARDKSFSRANNILYSKLKREAMLGLSKTTKQVIPPADILKITEYLTSKDNPTILRYRVWYHIFSHFANAGLEINKQLKPQDFLFLIDVNGKEYVSLSPETCLHHQKPANRLRNYENLADVKMYASQDLRNCPVRSLKLLILKTDASATALFNKVDRSSVENFSIKSVWYTNQPVKNNALASFMSEICRNSNCSKTYRTQNLKATASQGIYNLSVKSYTVMCS